MRQPNRHMLQLIELGRRHITPTRYLIIVNIIAAALGFAQGIITARYLGPAAYGVIAIIASINITVLNLLDIRVVDLVAKYFYDSNRAIAQGTEPRKYQASLLQISLSVNGLTSLVLSILGLMAGLFFAPLITTTPLNPQWLWSQSIILAMVNVTNTLDYLQRFSGRFYLMGSWRLLYRLAAVGIFLFVFLSNPTIDGYYHGLLWATGFSLGLSLLASIIIWQRYEATPFTNLLHLPLAWSAFRNEFRFLFFGNILSYIKMLHRGADVLLVGIFADDSIVGLYRLARSLTDTFNILFDAINQVYYPRFMEMLTSGATAAYHSIAKRLTVLIGGFTALLVVGEILFLEPLLRILLDNRFAGSETAIIIMTVPFFFIAGVSTWLWPLYVHSGKLGKYVIFNVAACLGQYGIAIILFTVFEPAPWMAALGYLAYYCILIPTAYITASAAYSAYIPKIAGR